MGIDNVAIKTFNSTGAQSVCRANEADETKLIESQFLTKCTTEYINGSGMSFISGQQEKNSLSSLTSDHFYFPSTSDAISEITLHVSLKDTDSTLNTVSKTFILDIINKIQIKLGNLTIQDIFPGDIYARNLTELGTVVNVSSYYPLSNNYYIDQTNMMKTIDFSLSIPFIGRAKDIKRSFLQAGAITNNLSMKVIYQTAHSNVFYSGNATISTGVCIFTHNMTNTEKNFISKNIINRVVNTSQNLYKNLPMSTSTTNLENGKITFDLSNINLNVSHILLTLNKNLLQLDGGTGPTGSYNNTFWSTIGLGATIASQDRGVIGGWLKSAELILGSDRTGQIPASCLSTQKIELFNLTSVSEKNIYIIKLAESSFSTAGVPFSRLSNKRLELYFNPITISKEITHNDPQIIVTCCGTRVQSTVGGSISFNA